MRFRLAAALALLTGSAALTGTLVAVAGQSANAAAATVQPACGTPAPMHARCLTLGRTDVHGGTGVRGLGAAAGGATGAAAALPAGYGPNDLDAAYSLPTGLGAGQTIGIVDAFDDPTAEADLAVYRQTYGLSACTSANGCFTKINQAGQAGNYPPEDNGWAAEISLDLDMVSAACPNCHILLVEANSSLVSDLAASVNTAVKKRANVVSNSYGTGEFNGMQKFYSFYRHSGHVIVASSGDFGFTTAQFPAVAPGVLAVGGTSLVTASNARGWTETAWSGAGSGCSAYVKKPTYQHDSDCSMRSIADVSADADPNTGLAIYDTTPNNFGVPPGWLEVGGTSASAPFIAAVIGLAGNAAKYDASFSYAHASALFDAVGGSNGFCGGGYLCTAVPGYDGPTGLGTPNGTGAF
ncbi:MAG: S53 family peptidase [Actinobacteria bacterium]|nr:S53 family peptidase [Actinomycetota bacterium]MBO0834548.1 S53 family peptidase [Actinomycetota bacterium]